MKIRVLRRYFDKVLNRRLLAGETFETDDRRADYLVNFTNPPIVQKIVPYVEGVVEEKKEVVKEEIKQKEISVGIDDVLKKLPTATARAVKENLLTYADLKEKSIEELCEFKGIGEVSARYIKEAL